MFAVFPPNYGLTILEIYPQIDSTTPFNSCWLCLAVPVCRYD